MTTTLSVLFVADLEFHNIEVYPPKDLEDDEEDLIVNQKLREIIPFAGKT